MSSKCLRHQMTVSSIEAATPTLTQKPSDSRSRFNGHQQFDWIEYIWHSSVLGSTMAHKSIISTCKTRPSFCWHQFSWSRILCHFIAIDIANALRGIFTQQIQIGSKSRAHMSADVCRVLNTSQLNWIKCVFPCESSHMWPMITLDWFLIFFFCFDFVEIFDLLVSFFTKKNYLFLFWLSNCWVK